MRAIIAALLVVNTAAAGWLAVELRALHERVAEVEAVTQAYSVEGEPLTCAECVTEADCDRLCEVGPCEHAGDVGCWEPERGTP